MVRGLVAVACVIGSVSALATEARADRTKADLLFDEGRKLANDGKYKEACDKFQAAIELDPEAPGTLLNLGQCNEKLGKLGTALGWYIKAEGHGRQYKMTEIVDAAAARIAAIESHVAIVKLEFAEPLPSDGKVTLDGVEVKREDASRMTLDSGHHKIEILAPHKRTVSKEVDATEGEQTVKFTAWQDTTSVVHDPGKRHRQLAYGAAGLAFASYAADVLLGLHYKHVYDRNCPDDVCSGDGRQLANQAYHDANLWTTSTFIAGTALGIGAVVLYLTAPKREVLEAVLPVVSKDQVGVAWSTRF